MHEGNNYAGSGGIIRGPIFRIIFVLPALLVRWGGVVGELLRQDYPGKKDMRFSRRWIFFAGSNGAVLGWVAFSFHCMRQRDRSCMYIIYEAYDIALCHVSRRVCLA